MSVSLDNSTSEEVSPALPEQQPTRHAKLLAAVAIIREPLWVIFCMFGLSVVTIISILKLFPNLATASEATSGQLIVDAAIYVLAVVFVLLPFLLSEERRKDIRSLLGTDKRLQLSGVAWALLAFGIYFWVTILVALLLTFVPGFDSEQPQNIGFDDVTTFAEYLMAFIGLVVIPPIFEELLFRGYLFGRLRKYVGFWVSTTVTSIAFGFVHGQWNVGVDTFILSFFLCFLRERTGSVWAPILLHAFKNGLAYFFLFIAPLWGFNLI